MISAWEIYFILKLDDIIHMLKFVGGFSLVAAIFLIVAYGIGKASPGSDNSEPPEDFGKVIGGVVLFWLLMSTIIMFLPTTKQAATIWAVPKIANSDFVQEDLPNEAKELYGMAKAYLQNVAEGDKEESCQEVEK